VTPHGQQLGFLLVGWPAKARPEQSCGHGDHRSPCLVVEKYGAGS